MLTIDLRRSTRQSAILLLRRSIRAGSFALFGIGIDVSKGKGTVAVIRPFGEIVKASFDVNHTSKKLGALVDFILSLDGIEYTGKYSEPIANVLSKSGIFVSAINAKLIHDYGRDTI